MRQLDRGGSNRTTESAWMVTASGRYFHALTPAFALFGGGGLGGTFGTSTRGLEVTDDQGRVRQVAEETTTRGFVLAADAGAAYLLRQRVQLRAGLDLAWILGSEEITSIKGQLGMTTFNTGLSLAAHVVF
ncbi:MAG: hypothetical protein R3F60_27410 [bacterium]